eukprot:scpid97668/ scgid27057/ 
MHSCVACAFNFGECSDIKFCQPTARHAKLTFPLCSPVSQGTTMSTYRTRHTRARTLLCVPFSVPMCIYNACRRRSFKTGACRGPVSMDFFRELHILLSTLLSFLLSPQHCAPVYGIIYKYVFEVASV